MAKVQGGATNVVGDFVKGVVVGSNGSEASTAQVAGDIAGALVPGLGEVKAVQDIWEGASHGNPALIIGGLVGLIPVVGAAGKAGGKVASKATAKATSKAVAKAGAKAGEKALAKVGQEVAEKTFKVSAMQLGQVAQKTVTKSLKNPETQSKLADIAMQAGERGLNRLVQRLQDMKAEGVSPEVHTRQHKSFQSARTAAFKGLGQTPAKDWDDLRVTGEDGKMHVVGRHEMGERGFRILADNPEPGASEAPLQLYWWKGGDNGKLTFGVEQCQASPATVSRVQEAYLNRNLSFRLKKG